MTEGVNLNLAMLNPFNYTLAELSKFLVALIFFVGYLGTMFIFVPPGLIVAIAAIVPAGFGVIAVFVRNNHELEPFNKAMAQLQSAVITVVVYFTAVPASTQNKITMAVFAFGSVLAVAWKRNATISAPVAAPVTHRAAHRA